LSVRLTRSPAELTVAHLDGFFEGWPTTPSPDRVLAAVRGADVVALAWDGDRLLGFATAITDGALSVFIPLVEVVPDRRGEGVGSRLVADLVERFDDRYGIDLCCDDDVVSFYEGLGFSRINGMVMRRPGVLP
jgi:GNAT superfamily N-acetyltransferase